jgi:hypothetical protein
VLFLGVGRIRFRGVYRANFSALGFIVKTHALYAFLGVYHVGRLALVDRAYRTFRFAGSAANALICDFVSHVFPPEPIIENIALLKISKGIYIF